MNINLLFIIFFSFLPLYNNLIINVGATGLLLPYTLGVLAYIKDNTNINKYNSKFIGTSGGSYCSLLYCLEDNQFNHDILWNIFFNNKNSKVYIYKNLHIYQNNLINRLINKYKNKNISELPIIIVVNKYKFLKLKNQHIYNFNDIKDLIYYCHCSSYIPFLSGYKFYYKYNNSKYVDGALIHKTIINNSNILNINYNMWGRNYNPYFTTYIDYNISNKLYQEGWNDTRDNFHKISHLF
tara:strand:- start:4353 stop:5069 length:717 start_codon:yes stop_codon:yes gene_type:complete